MRKEEVMGIKRTLEKLLERIDAILEKEGANVNFDTMTMVERGDYILDGACNFWGLRREDLLKKNNKLSNRRGYVATILRDYAKMGQQEIHELMKYSNHSSVTVLLRNMDNKLSPESWGDSRMRAVYKSLLEYLNLEPINNGKP